MAGCGEWDVLLAVDPLLEGDGEPPVHSIISDKETVTRRHMSRFCAHDAKDAPFEELAKTCLARQILEP
jgi:hypothetical protein